MPPESPISILLVEAQEIVREALAALLGLDRRFVVVGNAASGTEALSLASRTPADVVLMDLRLPGEDPFAILAEFRRRTAAARVLVITATGHSHDVAQCRELGAAGLLTMNATREQLVSALGRIARGGQCWEWVPARAAASPHGLTRRELEVLDSLRLGRTNDDIARAIGISQHTVKSHVKTLFAKLEVANRGEAVARGFELGILA